MEITTRRSPIVRFRGQIRLAGTTDGGVVTIENIMTAAELRVKDLKGP